MRNNQQYVATSTESICQYSPQETVEKFHYQVKTAVKMAVHEGIIERNFCDFTTIRSSVESEPKEAKFLEINEYTSLIECARQNIRYHSYVIIYLIAGTDIRFAEALGLTWNDISFENKIIDVNKIYNYNTTFDFAPTKNTSSVRKIPIYDHTVKLMKDYKEKCWIENKSE
ncbi:tyrosine-type recombinase/integrase [Streptococcus suis]|uniref:Integrase n=2 Tax=Streptococcus suis TaxID=1307 RepID=A0A0Z8VMD8_STRSU|nr:tyrosine-type recombinase/integrase [Streptococcus suis]MBM7311889.1 tyrosine-type recombinase/integrase [Streptococcus suis]MBO3756359.1 tyrosine-type recombinase/integrase [Streptococcus suis]NQH52234.1 tyrosine-type recombinase/integrase [Streptococcus suis]NQO80858.1 tyrosine-type recombinase/integrase [Streptococcus suis]NQO89157.1 tyrosine-type recombinase/integrase [Streptococcus suis]